MGIGGLIHMSVPETLVRMYVSAFWSSNLNSIKLGPWHMIPNQKARLVSLGSWEHSVGYSETHAID